MLSLNFFIIDHSRILYQEKGFIRIKTVSFQMREHHLFDSVFLKINFIVPHFIHSIANFCFNKFHTNKRHYPISLIWFDGVNPSSLADTFSIVLSLYIFAIPPGWFGRIRKPLHSKPHNTSSIFNQLLLYKSQQCMNPWTSQWSFSPASRVVHSITLVNSGLLNIVINK